MNGLIIGFKESEADRLKAEFPIMQGKLRAIMLGLNYDLQFYCKDYICITHIKRTQAEQDKFYADRIKEGHFCFVNGIKHYSKTGKAPTLSKHQLQYPMAVDIRTKCYQEKEKKFIKEWLNKYFATQARIIEDNRVGEHFHIEII